MSKETIAVDIDDVLSACAEGFVEYSNKKWGTHLTIDDYDEHWANMWKVDQDEMIRRREVMFNDKVFVNFSFRDESLPTLKELAKSYKMVIVSSRSKNIIKETIEWVHHHCKGIFSDIHFADIWNDPKIHTDEKAKMTKKEILQQIGADYLIDDQPKHCIAAAEAGIKSILFGDYGWSRDVELRPNMVRAKNWHEVMEYFDGRS